MQFLPFKIHLNVARFAFSVIRFLLAVSYENYRIMVHSLVFYYGEHPEQNASLNLNEDFNNTLLKMLMKYLIINNLLFHYFIILKNFKLDLFHLYCYLIFQCLLFNYFLSFN